MSGTIAGVGPYSRRGHRYLGFAPGGNVRRSSGFTNPNLSAISLYGWGFHTVRAGIKPVDQRFHPWGVGFVDIWKDF